MRSPPSASIRSLVAFLALALGGASVACGTSAPAEHGETDDELRVGPPSARADADAEGRASVRAGVLTLSFEGPLAKEVVDGEPALTLRGKASRNLSSLLSFVPDDAFGKATLTGRRTFEIRLQGGHEINTILSGMPLRLAVQTTSGAAKVYEAALYLGGHFESSSTPLRVDGSIDAVWSGVATDPLRYRTRVVAARGSVTDARTDLRGVQPRGWPPGKTWDQVPGAFMPDTNEVVVATQAGPNGSRQVPPTGSSHGSANLVLHEAGHALDYRGGKPSDSAEFQRAYEADRAAMPAYLQQPGNAGREEAYAETLALYLQDPAECRRRYPNLSRSWDTTLNGGQS